MTFWLVSTGLALCCGGVLALALLRGRVGAAPPAAYDLRVYRDQLTEIDRDLARGIIAQGDAERIRTEVSRRILSADAKLREGGDVSDALRSGGRGAALGLVLGLAACGAALYMWLGAPGYGDVPRAERLAASETARLSRLNQHDAEARTPPAPLFNIDADYAQLLDRLRATVADRGDDVQGLTLLARNEAAIGNFRAARDAQARLIETRGPGATAEDYALLADMMVSAAGGYVSSDAEGALRAALARSPENPRAHYYLGLYFVQIDRLDAAFRTWDQLLRASRPEDPWTPILRDQLPDLAWRAGHARYELPPVDPRGSLSRDQIEQAGEMSPEDRAGMIRGMVDGLSSRIEEEGGTVEEWARLTNALAVLGEWDRVRDTLERARVQFADQPLDLDLIENAAKQAGFSE
ncbi:MAG: c-type cytochrome biogenesis protein CcmI [Pseudomonadota bacterium]